MSFSVFDDTEATGCVAEAKSRCGDAAAWEGYERRTAAQSAAARDTAADGLLLQLAAMGALRGAPLGSPEVRGAVCALQRYITAHLYPCTIPILSGLGQLYAADERSARRIDAAGGEGTAAFAAAAIAAYCEAR